MTAVAITGAGAVTPLGVPPALWTRVRAGERVAGGAAGDLASAALPEAVRVRAARAERLTQLALVAAADALAGAGLMALDGPPRPQLGVVLGTAFGCFLTNAAHQRRVAEAGVAAASPRLFAATVSNAAAGEVGIAYRLGGPAVTLSAGAASGLVALGQAMDLLHAGRASALVAGGVDALGNALVRWLADGGLDLGRPPAEAAATMVLEPLFAARARSAPVLGVLAGLALGFEPGADAPGAGDGLAAAMDTALAAAAIAPGQVEMVVVAAPPAWAKLEDAALARVLGGGPRRMNPKAVFGETLGAAGPVGVLVALAEAPPGTAAVVLDVCASGHVGAAVVRCGAPA